MRGQKPGCCRFEQGLVLTAGEDRLDSPLGSPSFAGVRQRQFLAFVETELLPQPEAQAGLTVFHTHQHHYDLTLVQRDGQRAAVLRKRVCDMVTESPLVPLPGEGPVTLQIQSDKQGYRFFAKPQGQEPVLVGQGLSQLLSTEVMAGTFTGCFFGLFCQGQPGAQARFIRFTCRYSGEENESPAPQ